LNIIIHADKLGFAEAWIGEHYCIRWENLPAPELLIAKAVGLTNNIRLGSGVHVLAYHHPAVMAHKVAAMDHLARGRFLFGIGAGGTPSDFEMLGIDFKASEHRARMPEAIEMILALWASDGQMNMKGKFWDLRVPFPIKKMTWEYHLRPYQKPHPPIAVAGTSPFSGTLKWGAERGFIPMSIDASVEVIKSHWIAIQEGAAKAKRVMPRDAWRIARVIYVAETDATARKELLESSMARGFTEYFRRVYCLFNGLAMIKQDLSVPDEAVDINYMMEHLWLVGSVDTVACKLRKLYTDVGGFGNLLVVHFDTHPYPERYLQSMTLLKEQVIPKLAHLTPLPDTETVSCDPALVRQASLA
jgi:alkanesulfonate monooxygenase SsuD/methylene tetrahydromethanopterin reductase-like flavin-dependent oxidoreductase (luciferase family)